MRGAAAKPVTLASRTKRPSRGKHNLIRESIHPISYQKYNRAVTSFLEWCERNGEEDNGDPEDFDIIVSNYVQELYNSMESKSKAQTLRSALAFYKPSLNQNLGLTDRALVGWKRLEPPVSWPPITYGLALAAASALWLTEDYAHAAAILLAFECYLRNSETCNLRVRDVALPGDPRLGNKTTAMVVIGKAKTGNNQWVTIRDPLVIHILRYFTAGPAGAKLFPDVNPRSFRKALKHGLWLIGFENAPYVVHSLRHGGACRDYEQGMTLEDVLHRGRWRSVRTTRIYLKRCVALLLEATIPPEAAEAANSLERDRYDTFHMPFTAA